VIVPAPKPGFVVSDTLGCVPLKVDVTDKSVGAVVNYLYVIKKQIPLPPFKGDSVTSASFSYTFGVPGMYQIHQYLTGTSGCVTEDSVLVYVMPVFSQNNKPDIDYVSVDSTNAILIKWASWPGATHYYLTRYTDDDSSAIVGILTGSDTFYTDNAGIDPGKHSYTYKVEAQDGCGNWTGSGLVGRSVKLSGFEDQVLLPTLVWPPYKQWQNGIKNYYVYRQMPGAAYTLLANTVDTAYTDTGVEADHIYGLCYKVTAISNLSSQTGNIPFTATSNIYCFSESPKIYVPNAFTPNGDTLNDVFAPVCMGISDYNLTIINRWGEIVYQSSVTSGASSFRGQGAWDGSFKGITCPTGIYAWYLKAHDYNGHTITKQGKVELEW